MGNSIQDEELKKLFLTGIWNKIANDFIDLTPSEYSNNLAKQCKNTINIALQQGVNPNVLIPAHPIGYNAKQSHHAYFVIKNDNPSNDLIIDMTIGQMMPNCPPFIGTRSNLSNKFAGAFNGGGLNKNFMSWVSILMDMKNLEYNKENFFSVFYGDESLNYIDNIPIHIDFT